MQILVNGLIDGLNIGLIALAFTIVYFPTRVFHLALAGIAAAAPFVAWACLRNSIPLPLAVLIAVLVAASVSVACEVVNHWPLERRRTSETSHMISSLGLYIVLVTALAMIWGNEPKVLRTGVDSVLRLGHVILTSAQLVSAATSLVAFALFYTWLRFSNIGLRFRALADNPVETALRGHNVRRLRLMAFAIAGAFAALGALATGYDLGFDPHIGLSSLLLAVVAMIVGGRRSFLGPVVGGLILGLVRSSVVWFLSSRWEGVVTFLLMGIFLLFRPNGLIEQRNRLEAES